jgi:signal transduction histidine kinase
VNLERAQLASELLRELRTPLARISLAVEEISAHARHPAQTQLAARIEDALLSADAGIERVIGLLREPKIADRAIDAARELARLRERVAPALAARGIEWPAPELTAPSAEIRIDATQLRRGALCVLRAATEALASGGWLRIEVACDGVREGLRLWLGAPAGRAEVVASRSLRAGALMLGAGLELDTANSADAAAAASAALWFSL